MNIAFMKERFIFEILDEVEASFRSMSEYYFHSTLLFYIIFFNHIMLFCYVICLCYSSKLTIKFLEIS